MQLQKSEAGQPDVTSFDALKEYFENLMPFQNGFEQTNVTNSNIGGITSNSNSISSKLNKFGTKKPWWNRNIKFEASPTLDLFNCDELHLNDKSMNLLDYNQVTTLKQRLLHPEHQSYDIRHLRPRRINLRSKTTKRCRTCEHILIKPEQKAQVTKMKVKLIASDFLPSITIAPPFLAQALFKPEESIRFVLRFSNRQSQEISLSLATPSTNSTSCDVTILTPNFTVPPFNELWEYDDDVSTSYSDDRVLQQLNSATGIYEKRRNYTCILIQVVPHTGRLEFPMMVSVTWDVVKPGHQVMSSEPFSGEKNTRETISYWVWIGLGFVENIIQV